MSIDTTTHDSGTGATGGQPDPSTVASLPAFAQKMIKELRTEAATNRTALQEMTVERDTAKTAIIDVHRRDALAGLDKVLADPADLGRFANLDELVDEAGNPDPEKYSAAAKSLIEKSPHLGSPRPSSSGGETGIGRPTVTVNPDVQEQAGKDAFVNLVHGM